MTKAAIYAAIDAVIKNNTSGSDFITPSELNEVLKLVADMLLVSDLTAYDSRTDATAALGAGKPFVASSAAVGAAEGTVMLS